MIWLRLSAPMHTWHQKQMLRCLERGDRTFFRFNLKLMGLFFACSFVLIVVDIVLRAHNAPIRDLVFTLSSLVLVLLFFLLSIWTSRFWDQFSDGIMGNVQRAEKLRELRERFEEVSKE